jgi:hypothetical protein
MDKKQLLFLYEGYQEMIRNFVLRFGGDIWLKPKDIDVMQGYKKTVWSDYDSDNFVKEASKDKSLLGKSIVKNGTYWPIFIADNKYYGNPVVVLGQHRIEGLKDYFFKNPNKEKELLCIKLDSNFFIDDEEYVLRFSKANEGPTFLDKPFKAMLPKNGELVERVAKDYAKLVIFLRKYPKELNESIFEAHKAKYPIKGFKAFNDKKAWEDFIGVR